MMDIIEQKLERYGLLPDKYWNKPFEVLRTRRQSGSCKICIYNLYSWRFLEWSSCKISELCYSR